MSRAGRDRATRQLPTRRLEALVDGVFAIAITLLVIEIKITSFGLLAAGGIASLVFGSLMLIDSPIPELRLGLRVVLPVSFGLAAIVLFLVRLGVQSQRRRAVTGDAGMLGERGRALTPIGSGRSGRVSTHGEIWNARAEEPIAEGDEVVVTAVQGLELTVRRAGPGGASEGGA